MKPNSFLLSHALSIKIYFLPAPLEGVPRHLRGEIWKFLAEQYRLRHQFPSKQQPKDTPYKELLKRLTSQQHAILIDLGKSAVSVTCQRKLLSLEKWEETVGVA